jgi:hypothetical protein
MVVEYGIASETLPNYQNHKPDRDSRIDFEKGEADGRSEYPPSDATNFSTFEQQRISAARTALNEYVRRMRTELDGIDERISRLEAERDHDYVSRKDMLFEQKKQALKEASNMQGTNSQRHRELLNAHDERRRAFQAQEFETGRPPRISMADPIIEYPFLYWTTPYIIVLVLLAILEIPINSRAIELAFEFTPPLSYVLAGLVGTIFVLLAHFTGIQLLRVWHAPGWLKLWHALISVLTIGFATVLVVILFEMRGQADVLIGAQTGPLTLDGAEAQPGQTQTAEAVNLIGLLFTDPIAFFEAITSGGGEEDTRFAQLGLLLLNVLVFLVGTVLSILRHDPDPNMERAYGRYQGAERRLNRFMSKYRERVARIEAEFGRKISATERRADQIHNDITALRSEREQLSQQIDNDMRSVLNVLAEQIAAYQRGNRSTRTTREPAYFGSQGIRKLGSEVLVE